MTLIMIIVIARTTTAIDVPSQTGEGFLTLRHS